jgi:hypothetical protein
MGLLASFAAYLSVVAAIVIGFLMSADALLHDSHQLAANQRPEIITAAKTDLLKTKNAVKPSRNAAEQRAIPQKKHGHRISPQNRVFKQSRPRAA